MQVNTDSVAILTKQVLKSEVEVLKSRLQPQDTGNLYTAIAVLEKRIEEELEENPALEESEEEQEEGGAFFTPSSKTAFEDLQIENNSDMDIDIDLGLSNVDLGELNYDKATGSQNLNVDEELSKIVRNKTNEQLNQFSNLFLNKLKKDITINEL